MEGSLMEAAERVYFLNERELSERLRGPLGSVRKWRRLHVGPPHLKIGRHVRYSIQDVEAWLQTRLHLNGCAQGKRS